MDQSGPQHQITGTMIEAGSDYESNGVKHSQSQLLRTHPLQGNTDVSQSNTTDLEEIYDSVRSLSQAALDDSLNFKKEQARLVQQQAAREIEEDKQGYDGNTMGVQGHSHNEESEIATETDEDAGQDVGRMSALQQMLQQSELFIRKQTSSATPQNQYSDHNFMKLPGVQAQDSSQLDDFDSYQSEDQILRASNFDASNKNSLMNDSDQDFGERTGGKLIVDGVTNQHMRKSSTQVHSQKELETVHGDKLLVEDRQTPSELTVIRNTSQMTVLRAADQTPNKVFSDSLNTNSNNNGMQPSQINTNNMMETYNSDRASSYATPVVGARDSNQNRPTLISPRAEEIAKRDDMGADYVSRTKSPSLAASLNQSIENYGSFRVYEDAKDDFNDIEATLGSGVVFDMDEHLTYEQVSDRRTLRQSIDETETSSQRRKEACPQLDQIQFLGAPNLISSSSSCSENSSGPQQVSAAASRDCVMGLQSDIKGAQQSLVLNQSEQSSGMAMSPALSAEDIKVMNFGHQEPLDSAENLHDLQNDQIAQRTSIDPIVGSRSEAKESYSPGLLNGQLLQQHAVSLTNSLKKQNPSQQNQHSDCRTRSFSDVLNCMRDTEELEKEKQLLLSQQQMSGTQEMSPEQLQSPHGNGQVEIQYEQTSQQEQEQEQPKQSVRDSQCEQDTDQREVVVDFVTDDDQNKASAPICSNPVTSKNNRSTNDAYEVVRIIGPNGSQIEVYSDSLNTRSEDRKFQSINSDDHRSSPSFYRIDDSDNEQDVNVQEDRRESQRNSYVPASSFASGAQAQIAYSDNSRCVNKGRALQIDESRSGRPANPQQVQPKNSSHYRGESFGNCLPLTSVATSSQRDSVSADRDGHDTPDKKVQQMQVSVSLEELPGQLIYEHQADEEESNGHNSQVNNSSSGQQTMPLDQVVLIEDEFLSEQFQHTDRDNEEKDQHLQKPNVDSNQQQNYASQQEVDEEQRVLVKSLSKTDSLRDLNAFFLRDQARCRTDGDQLLSDEGERTDQHSSIERQSQIHKLHSSDVIAEENLEDSSPERTRNNHEITETSKQISKRSRKNSLIDLQNLPIERGGRESQKFTHLDSSMTQNEGTKRIQSQVSNTREENLHQKIKINGSSKFDLSMSMVEMVEESEVLAGNGPPQSINQSDYSLLKILVDKALKSPKQESSSENILVQQQDVLSVQITQEAITTLKKQNKKYNEQNQKLQLQLSQSDQKNIELENKKRQAMARIEMLESQNSIQDQQRSQEKLQLEQYMNKYKKLRGEFKKMQRKYESELTKCVDEMENLRIIVTDVVSQPSEHRTQSSLKQLFPCNSNQKAIASQFQPPVHIVQSSTGEPALLLEADHSQSEKVLGLRNSLHKRSQNNNQNVYRDETTSSESPNRPIARQPLLKTSTLKKSNRFSSHEQFSIGSSQNQTARFSIDLSQNRVISSAYGDQKPIAKSTRLKRIEKFKTIARKAEKADSSNSSLFKNQTQKFMTKVLDGTESKFSKSTQKSLPVHRSLSNKQRSQKSPMKDESYKMQQQQCTLFNQTSRTIDLVKQTVQSSNVFQYTKHQHKIKQTQNLQNMLSSLYQQQKKTTPLGVPNQEPVSSRSYSPMTTTIEPKKSAKQLQRKTILMRRP